MIIQDIPSDKFPGKIRKGNLLIPAFVGNGQQRVVVLGKNPDIMIFIRGRLRGLRNGKVPVHSLVL